MNKEKVNQIMTKYLERIMMLSTRPYAKYEDYSSELEEDGLSIDVKSPLELFRALNVIEGLYYEAVRKEINDFEEITNGSCLLTEEDFEDFDATELFINFVDYLIRQYE